MVSSQFTLANAATASWSVTANATNIVINKNNLVGSGGTTPGTTVVAQVMVLAPHTIL